MDMIFFVLYGVPLFSVTGGIVLLSYGIITPLDTIWQRYADRQLMKGLMAQRNAYAERIIWLAKVVPIFVGSFLMLSGVGLAWMMWSIIP